MEGLLLFILEITGIGNIRKDKVFHHPHYDSLNEVVLLRKPSSDVGEDIRPSVMLNSAIPVTESVISEMTKSEKATFTE